MAEPEKDPIRVLIAMDFSEELIENLRTVSDRLEIEQHHPSVPDAAYENVEVLYTARHFPMPSQAPNLRWVQIHSAGVERVLDRPTFQNTGVKLTSASGIHAVQMSEYCLGVMLHFHYRFSQMMQIKAQGKWPEKPYETFKPHGLRDLTLGIVGYGSIGRELARFANALGMIVLATKRDIMHQAEDGAYTESETGDPEGDIPERLYPPAALGSMASECDFLVVTVPYTDATHHMIDKNVLGRMKKSAVLINVARGGVIDEAALINVLKNGKIAGAGLDVFEEEPLPSSSPLWKLDNVLISPHVSGNTSRYHEKVAMLFAENLQRYITGKRLLNLVDRDHGY